MSTDHNNNLLALLVQDQVSFLISLDQNPQISKLLSIDQKMLLDRMLVNATKLRVANTQLPPKEHTNEGALLTRKEFFAEAKSRFGNLRDDAAINDAIDEAISKGKLRFKKD